jgi:hypothetical protein
MGESGGCHCGAIRYEVTGDPQHFALCHCSDCRKSAGAPMVGWAAFGEGDVTITQGQPSVYNSSGTALRSFCATCGTGLFYRNAAFLPGIIDVQAATFDNDAAFAPGAHIQTAERLSWMASAHDLPAFDRYPGQ